MIVTINDLLIKYANYADPYGKIKRDVDANSLFPLVKGLYETNSSTPGYYLSSSIYGPSYLSFEFALSYHNLIPEKVVIYTSATYSKNKKKEYINKFGLYRYRDVPKKAFPYGIKVDIINDYSVLMATPEKAICDMLYICETQKNVNNLKLLMFEDLRINIDGFSKVNKEVLKNICTLYKSQNLKLLHKILEGEIQI